MDRSADGPPVAPAPGMDPTEPTTHAVLRDEPPAEASSSAFLAATPPMLEVPDARGLRGNPLASQVGFALAALGLALVSYSFYYASTNYPANFNPGGLSGIRTGAGLFLLGAIVGILFLFVPASRPVPMPLDERTRAYQLRVSRTMSGAGIGLTVLGLLVATAAYRSAMTAGVAPADLAMAGMTAGELAAVGCVLALAGVVLWTAFGLRARAFGAPPMAGAAYTAMSPLADPMPGAAPSSSVAHVTKEELHAMMRRIDSMLAGLPDEVVRDFSRSSEADTYLKLMRESEPERA